MQTSVQNTTVILIISTSVILLIVGFVLIYAVIFQRRMLGNQQKIQQLETEKQEALLKAVLETQEFERGRLAQDLHDSVGQVLSAIKLNVRQLDKLSNVEPVNLPRQQELLKTTHELTEDCISEIRNIIRNILPPVLRDFGLASAIKDLAEKVQNSTDISVIYHQEGEDFRFRKENEMLIYRVVQELFNNAIKHSQGSQFKLDYLRNPDALSIIFEDNGIGFDPDQTGAGLGLKGMQSRVQLLKGDLKVYSKQNQGSRTEVIFRNLE
ncbi:sensor histidine kinase [Pseudarcicella hirudinis]